MPTPATVVTTTAVPSTGTEGTGKTITIKVKMSRAVTVNGTPELMLNDGGIAYYVSGSGTATLVFSYQVGASDTNETSLAVQSYAPNGGAVDDLSGHPADFSNVATTFTSLAIDTTPPTVTLAKVTPVTGDERDGKIITFKLTFSEVVNVANGGPMLELNDGDYAYYESGSGTKVLTFSYEVENGDTNVPALAITGVDNGSSVTDKHGNAADFTNALTTFAGLQITATPMISSVVSQPVSGIESVGTTIDITLNFNEAVTVKGGTPFLQLNDGGIATYKSGSGTAALTFAYTVASTDTSVPNLAVTGAFTNGANIQDALHNAADLSGATQTFAGLAVSAAPENYGFFDLNPGSSGYATGVNDLGQVVGNYHYNDTTAGFLFSGGSYTTIDDLGDGYYAQTAQGINNLGQIVGSYDYQGASGYVENADGSGLTILDDPNAIPSYAPVTVATAINNESVVVGNYNTFTGDTNFTYNDSAESEHFYTDLTGVPAGTNYFSDVTGLNDNGTFVGNFSDTGTEVHGFIYQGGSTPIQLDDPLAATDGGGTFAEGINDAGEVVGYYIDNAGQTHGFLYQNGAFTTIDDIPDGGAGGTQLYGINNAGQIVGAENGTPFVATPGIDLKNVAFETSGGSITDTIGYAPNSGNTGGTITVNDGTHQATITVVGQFTAGDFHLASDFSGGTFVTDPSLSGTALATFLASQHT